MSIAEKLTQIAENEQKVFDAGKKAEYDAFWDKFQNYGKNTNFQYSFCNYCWNDDTFKPKYDIVLGLGYSGTNMFWGCEVTNIAEALEKQGVKLDTTLCGYFVSMFQNTATKRIPELNCTHAMDYSENGLHYTFINSKVETIDKMVVTESLKYISTFQGCANLKNIIFEGVIGQSINFQWSPLSVDSMKSVISHLKNCAGTSEALTYSVKFNEECWTVLEADGVSPTGTTWEDYVTSLGWTT